MLIGNKAGFGRMTQFCKTRVPPALIEGTLSVIILLYWLFIALNACADDDAVKAFGIEYITDMCRQLLRMKVDGLHFYTLNASAATLAVVENLKNDDLLLLLSAAALNDTAAAETIPAEAATVAAKV